MGALSLRKPATAGSFKSAFVLCSSIVLCFIEESESALNFWCMKAFCLIKLAHSRAQYSGHSTKH